MAPPVPGGMAGRCRSGDQGTSPVWSVSGDDPLPKQSLCQKLPGRPAGFWLVIICKVLPMPLWGHATVQQNKQAVKFEAGL